MTALKLGATIGIIGGGQLARMLAMAAGRLGYRTLILEPQDDCPAAQMANGQIVAAYDDEKALIELAQRVDVVTYEFENVPVGAAKFLLQSVLVDPQPKALEVSQDRFLEKQFFNQCGVETAPWYLVNDQATLSEALEKCANQGILKTRRMGYDGKGQIHLEDAKPEIITMALEAVRYAPAILEGVVDFSQEVSVVAARSREGDIVFYDIPQNIHRGGILHQSIVPARLKLETKQAAHQAVSKILEALQYVGILAVEFFVLPDGRLIANEMAPRVHNSGHWTEAACAVSQFEQHIRAVAGLPLGATHCHSHCVMENLIGEDLLTLPELLKEKQTVIHLYGKREIRQGRKMGHVTRLQKNEL